MRVAGREGVVQEVLYAGLHGSRSISARRSGWLRRARTGRRGLRAPPRRMKSVVRHCPSGEARGSPRRRSRPRPATPRKAGHASRAAARSSLLNTTSIGFWSSAGSCASSSSRMTAWSQAGSFAAPSTTWSRIRVRSTWRRKAWPRPSPADAPSIRPGHVGDRRQAPVLDAEVHHAEVRLEGRERVGRDLRRRVGQRREERGLAGVREPDEPHVGDQPELEPEPLLLARLAALRVLGRLVDRRREVRVAEAAAAALRDHDLLARPPRGRRSARRSRRPGRPSRAGPRGTGRHPPCRGASGARRGRRASPRSGACSGSRGARSGRRPRAGRSSRRGRRRRHRGRRGARGPPGASSPRRRRPCRHATKIRTSSRNIVVIVACDPARTGRRDRSGRARLRRA